MLTGPILGALSIVAKGPGSSQRRTTLVLCSLDPVVWPCGRSVSRLILTVIVEGIIIV